MPTALLAIAPHVVVHTDDTIWVDARGLDLSALARGTLDIARRYDEQARVGAAGTPIAAHVAAVHGQHTFVVVPDCDDAKFLAPFPLAVLSPSPKLADILRETGLATCADLARVTQEAMEVRFGMEGVALWKLARADDPRRIFTSVSRQHPSASLAWEDYVVRNAEQLAFVANRLVTTICTDLQSWGEVARHVTLGLTLADRTILTQPLRTARPTAERATWMRLVRRELERLRVFEGVVGMSLTVDDVGRPEATQGDLFDRGFQTAHLVHDALGRLEEDGYGTLMEVVRSAHPLPERRNQLKPRVFNEQQQSATSASTPRLVLQLFPEPPRVAVTERSDGTRAPSRFHSPVYPSQDILTALGPDVVSGTVASGPPYTRAYFTCLATNGLLVLLYRDIMANEWFLQGWWD